MELCEADVMMFLAAKAKYDEGESIVDVLGIVIDLVSTFRKYDPNLSVWDILELLDTWKPE